MARSGTAARLVAASIMLMLLSAIAEGRPGAVYIDKERVGHDRDHTTFSFNEEPDATGYQVALVEGGSVVLRKWFKRAAANCDGRVCTIAIDRLTDGDYSLWIRTYGDGEHGPWSNRCEFAVSYVADSMDDDGSSSDMIMVERTLWLNHLALVSTDPAVALFPAAGGTLVTVPDGIVESTPAALMAGLQVPPGYLLTGAEVCFFIEGAVELADLRISSVIGEAFVPTGEAGESACAEGQETMSIAFADPVDPASSPLNLAMDISFLAPPDPALDRLSVSGLALTLVADADDPSNQVLLGHTHEYLTGRGKGHNNTVSETSGARSGSDEKDEEDE